MMVNWDRLSVFLREKSGVCQPNLGNTELIIRCYSEKCEQNPRFKKTHGHMYVSKDEDYPVYNCFKCGEKGHLVKLITRYGGDPKDFIEGEINVKSDYIKKIKYSNDTIYKYPILDVRKKRNELKLQYLRGRLGLDYPIDKIPNLIFSIRDFIDENNLVLTNIDSKLIDIYEETFIGFITTRGSKLILRNCNNLSSFSYGKINLKEDNTGFKDFYGFITNNIKEDAINRIVLSEGIFDFLVAYNHTDLDYLRKDSYMWVSILGNSYSTSLMSILDYCCLSLVDITVLSDSDYKESNYEYLKDNPSVNSLEIFWNRYEKDFGSGLIGTIKKIYKKRWNYGSKLRK